MSFPIAGMITIPDDNNKKKFHTDKTLNLQKNFTVFLSLWKIESCLDNWKGVGVASGAMAADGSIKGTQEWEYFWFRFWILYYFDFGEKNFLIGPAWGGATIIMRNDKNIQDMIH